VREADEVVVAPEDEEASEEDVAEVAAEDSKAMQRIETSFGAKWFLIFPRCHAGLQKRSAGYLLWAECSCMDG